MLGVKSVIMNIYLLEIDQNDRCNNNEYIVYILEISKNDRC